MAKSQFDVGAFVITMVLLFVGGFLAGWIIPMIPGLTGWIAGIATGMIQMLIIVLVGAAVGKMTLWNVLLGGIVIFIGGLVGGFLAGFLNFSGLYATIITLAVQTLLLSTMGLIRGAKTPKLG